MKRRFSDAELREWVTAQLTIYRQGRLSTRATSKLETIQGWTWNKKVKSSGEWVIIAEELTCKNGGKLPSSMWLIHNGYSGLYVVLRNSPKLFSHLEQEKPQGHYKSNEDWVPVAEEFARKNGGKLPKAWWLCKNGYSGLYAAIKKRPELFNHIKKDAPRTPEEYVSIAEGLARNNGGTIPKTNWLMKNGYSGLYGFIRKRRELFKHIDQYRRYIR
jgi:hypothetical protein